MNLDSLDTNGRVKKLNVTNLSNGESVIYVMSRDQRIHDNHALLEAQKHAISKNLPLAVVFCLHQKSGYRTREHYIWMLEGLKEIEMSLKQLNIPFMLLFGDPLERINGCIKHLKPDGVYFDFNPLKGPSKLRQAVASANEVPVYEVDTHNIVPVWVTSDKQEYAARTIRPKIHKHLSDYLSEPEPITKQPVDWNGKVMSINELTDRIDQITSALPSNQQDKLKSLYPPGEKNAHQALDAFLSDRLKNYASDRNDPSVDGLSGLSPYLHFGNISSLRIILETLFLSQKNADLKYSYDILLEEMVVRKELSDNYCLYNANYDKLDGAEPWAKATLSKHSTDERQFLYSLDDFRQAKTHDKAWNAAQVQLLKTGKIHGYMRMYWAKKVLEWSSSPEEALKTLIYLNDFYSIDGGDPNGYVGILWSVAGLHDRPWGERQVYGTIRSMVYDGLKRKFDIQKYIDTWTV